MADEVFALVARDRVVAHPVEIIIGRVVLTDMIEAEAEILSLAQPAHRRAEFARFLAARIIAAHAILARLVTLLWLDPDAIEQG